VLLFSAINLIAD